MGRDFVTRDGVVFDPEQLAATQEELGNAWADLHAAAELLEGTEKSVLAQVSLEFRNAGLATSGIDLDRMARASVQYMKHVKDAVEARRLANRARVKYEAHKAFIELLRTQMATERAMAQLA